MTEIGRGKRKGQTPILILASSSPRRKKILKRLGLEFEVFPISDDVEGEPDRDEAPDCFAARAACAKADAVIDKRESLVIVAADTVVTIDGEILGKPSDSAEATRMIRRLAGRRHVVHTGVAIRDSFGGTVNAVESSTVCFRSLSDAEIEAYVATGESLDKAGGYAIQGYGSTLVQGIEGCYFNVVGLPVVRLLSLLDNAGWTYVLPGRLHRRTNYP